MACLVTVAAASSLLEVSVAMVEVRLEAPLVVSLAGAAADTVVIRGSETWEIQARRVLVATEAVEAKWVTPAVEVMAVNLVAEGYIRSHQVREEEEAEERADHSAQEPAIRAGAGREAGEERIQPLEWVVAAAAQKEGLSAVELVVVAEKQDAAEREAAVAGTRRLGWVAVVTEEDVEGSVAVVAAGAVVDQAATVMVEGAECSSCHHQCLRGCHSSWPEPRYSRRWCTCRLPPTAVVQSAERWRRLKAQWQKVFRTSRRSS